MSVKYLAQGRRVEVHLSEESSWKLFDSIAAAIVHQFGGRWVQQLDGLDQRYWDLKLNDVLLTLHLEHYTGISLFPAQEPGDLTAANSLVETIGAFLEEMGTIV